MSEPFRFSFLLLCCYLLMAAIAYLFSLVVDQPDHATLVDQWELASPVKPLVEDVDLAQADAKRDPRVEQPIPDFSELGVDERKQAFVDFMLPMILAENIRLQQKRLRIIEVADSPDDEDQDWLYFLRQQYRVPGEQFDLSLLLQHVDMIPPSLALAQAANESGWGTSRFATQGNNLFGQWCFSSGCGIVPLGRPSGASYEVKVFASPQESVADYMLNLNRHHAYRSLRQVRYEQRMEEGQITGLRLAQGLLSYSARGQDYVDEVQQMIRSNQFDLLDNLMPLLTPSEQSRVD